MTWSKDVWSQIDGIYSEILESPFIDGLTTGTLPRKRFIHFLRQDVIYLRDYARALAALAVKAPTLSLSTCFAKFSASVEEAELQIHQQYLNEDDEGVETKPHATCQLYTSYLMKQAAVAPIEVLAAAVLPCFWIYQKVGNYALANVGKANPYYAWAQGYAGEEFDESTEKMISICDSFAEATTPEIRDRMSEAFIVTARLEQQFFQAAYDLEEWPPLIAVKQVNPPAALSIAGSDPSGGAGIQADIKAMQACGAFAQTAITAVVNENTVGVYGVHAIPVEFVQAQIRSVLDDIGAQAIKIGMLHSSELIHGVTEVLRTQKAPIVLDPVMVSTSGDNLLEPDAVETLKAELLPLATIITPNLSEAAVLLGVNKDAVAADMKGSAKSLSETAKGASVLLKAGHLTGDIVEDVFYNGKNGNITLLPSPRIQSKNTHGTGCTLSSALAAFLARGFELEVAAQAAKDYIVGAIAGARHQTMAKGNGPVDHFYQYRHSNLQF